jgi:outer membrane protein assembly factor BamB
MTTSPIPRNPVRAGVLPFVFALMVLLSGCDIFGTAVDERAPRLSIVTPYDNALVSGKHLLISVDAEALGDDNWVSFVTINMNGEQVGTAEYDGTYYNLRVNTFDLEDAVYRIEAIAFDRYQARGISAPVLVSVRNQSDGPGPRMSITDPNADDTVFGVIRVAARPDPGEPFVSRVDLLVNGIPVATEDSPVAGDTFIFDYDTLVLPLGEHTLEVKAYSGPTVFRVSESVNIFLKEDDGSNEGRPGALRWKTPGISGDVDGAPAVGFNNDIYIGSTDQKLYAFSNTGTLKWTYETKGSIDSSPLVGNNEDIFVTASGGRLYGLGSEGSRLWGWANNYSTGAEVRSSPTLGSDGTIYFGDSAGKLHAVSSFDGLKPSTGFWPANVTAGQIVTPPVIGRDRTIFVAATDGHVYAYDPEGVRVWKSSANIGSVMVGMAMVERQISVTLPTGDVRTTTAVVLYIVSNNGLMYAMAGEDGSVLWSYPLTGPLRSAPVVGPDGTIYVGTSTGLIALNEDVDTFTPRLRFVHVAADVGTPVIDSNEFIYFMSDRTLKAIHPNNVPAWEYHIGSYADGPLTITRDGALLVAAENGYLYAFETGSVGLNPEQWPTFQRNARHTGRLGIDATDG